MSQPLTAQDLWPLVLKLSLDEQRQLAERVLRTAQASQGRGMASQLTGPLPPAEEPASHEDRLALDAESWDLLDVAPTGVHG